MKDHLKLHLHLHLHSLEGNIYMFVPRVVINSYENYASTSETCQAFNIEMGTEVWA